MKRISRFFRESLSWVQRASNKISKQLDDRRSPLYNVVLAVSVLLLLSTTVYAAFNTSNYFSTNSDAIIATHQFSDDVAGNTVALPGSHSNMLMMPLLYVQGHMPYRYKSFTAVNILLVLVTVSAWAILLIRLFGRKYEVPILVLLSSLMFASVTFNIGIGNTTFRNLAYPIALWFVLIISDLLKKTKPYSRKRLSTTIIGSVLFCVVLAGDSFFNYSILAPLLIVIIWYWLQSRKFTGSMLRAVGLMAGVAIGAAVIKWVFVTLKIVYLDYVFLGKPTILPSEHLGPSIQVTLRQLMELQGGSIFGIAVGPKNLLVFLNFGILILGVAGLIMILRRANRSFLDRKGIADVNDFVFVTLAVSYFVILIEYVLSGYAVIKMPNGQIIDFMNTRYLTLLPLITIVGFVWLLKNYYKEQRYVIILCLMLVVGVAAYYPAVNAIYKLQDQNKPAPSKTSIDEITGYLDKNHIKTVVTDFWYGPPIRFWSSDAVRYAPIINCNQPIPFDSREDWFKPAKGEKTALIIDRGGLNFGYWSCTDEQLMQIYGEPASKAVTAGIKPGETVNIWVYNYDVRERLQPFPIAK